MTKGIRILDKKARIVTVELSDILEEINNGDQFEWSLFYLQATGDLGKGKSIPEFEQQIIGSEKGFFITWKELNNLSQKFWDLMDITVIGCKDKNLLRRYKNDQEMYKTCDIVIEMIDSGYWEVFSKDEQLINRLAEKFKEIKFLEPDFEK
ncbi:MAG: hypothetical protein ACM3JI_04825 [Anaerolineae bacterium]